MHSVLSSIRSTLVPIRREGRPFIAAFVVAALILGLVWQPLFWIGLILSAWCIYFFRDPKRVIPVDPALVVSPADGRVSFVGLVAAPKELSLDGRQMRRISVFMSVFDCHVNRAAVAGRVEKIHYVPGKFLNAELDKASELNERNALLIASPNGSIGIVQIAGLVARRIVCDVREGAELSQGERIGMIRFGSRLDVYLPPEATVLVAEGQTAIAGETVIARFGAEAAERRARID